MSDIQRIHGVSREEAVELQRQLIDLERDADVLEAGLAGEFWKVIQKHLTRVSDAALRDLMFADPTDTKVVTMLQTKARIYAEVEGAISATIEESRAQIAEFNISGRE